MTATKDHQKNFSRRIKAFGRPGKRVGCAQGQRTRKNAGHYKHFSHGRVIAAPVRESARFDGA
ncbi:hypothetical protein D3C81_723580 [compost metagenome]